MRFYQRLASFSRSFFETLGECFGVIIGEQGISKHVLAHTLSKSEILEYQGGVFCDLEYEIFLEILF